MGHSTYSIAAALPGRKGEKSSKNDRAMRPRICRTKLLYVLSVRLFSVQYRYCPPAPVGKSIARCRFHHSFTRGILLCQLRFHYSHIRCEDRLYKEVGKKRSTYPLGPMIAKGVPRRIVGAEYGPCIVW
ncbi:hypothetical protein HOY82DRAFT_579955 [Tuber indicum]|nr:hypothetical protein HOY82DRAFT_579955 [Tuber indicum]